MHVLKKHEAARSSINAILIVRNYLKRRRLTCRYNLPVGCDVATMWFYSIRSILPDFGYILADFRKILTMTPGTDVGLLYFFSNDVPLNIAL